LRICSLKEQARDRRLRAIDPEELHALQQRARRFRHWRTALGMVAFAGELPPEIGVPIMTRVDAEADRLWFRGREDANKRRRAESEGSVGPDQLWDATVNGSSSTQERRATIAADAFVRLVETGGKGKAHTADLVIVCDLQAYRRGHAYEGEPCHIVGGGPIPVSLARELGQDAFLKVVLHDGVKIDTIAHFGRKTSPCCARHSRSGRLRCSMASSVRRRDATGALISRKITSIRWPTEG
jgi:hypothetical protein